MRPGLVGRAHETAVLRRFLDAGGSQALVIAGEAGIGKSALLAWARDHARERDLTVLAADPVEHEMPLEFSVLADLLEPVDRALVRRLPAPQQRAVEVSVFRHADPADPSDPVDPRTLATAVLTLFGLLAASAPVLVTVDDMGWIDPPSARVLAYALRRTPPSPVRWIGTIRTGWSETPTALVTDALAPGACHHLTLGPLDPESLATLVRRTGHPLADAAAPALHRQARGNPLFALELAAEGADDRSAGSPTLRRLLRRRTARLSPGARDLLLLAALCAEPTLDLLTRAAGGAGTASAMEEIRSAGLVTCPDRVVAFTHPLIRSELEAGASPAARRAAHRRLADVTRNEDHRARHLALGAPGPDEAVAARVEAAARAAAARGATETAASLAHLAVTLTPDGEEGWRRRAVLEADSLMDSAQPGPAAAVLGQVVGGMPPSPERAELRRRQARCMAYAGEPFDQWLAQLAPALEEAGGDRSVRGRIQFDIATAAANHGDSERGVTLAAAALEDARASGDAELEARIQAAMTFGALQHGQGLREDLVAGALRGPPQPANLAMELRPLVAVAHALHFSDHLGRARRLYELEYQRALADGIDSGLPLLLGPYAQNELWAGEWDHAAELSAAGVRAAEESGSPPGLVLTAAAQALLEVLRGHTAQGVARADEAMATGLAIGFPMGALLAAQALGVAGLAEGDARSALDHLAPVLAVVDAVGIPEPGLVPFVTDAVEALIRLGELDRAGSLLERFERPALALGRPRARVTALRCRGLLLASAGDPDGARRCLEEAVAAAGRLPFPLERGRTRLVAGEVARRSGDGPRPAGTSPRHWTGSPAWVPRAGRPGRLRRGGASACDGRRRARATPRRRPSPRPNGRWPSWWWPVTPTPRSPPICSWGAGPSRPTCPASTASWTSARAPSCAGCTRPRPDSARRGRRRARRSRGAGSRRRAAGHW